MNYVNRIWIMCNLFVALSYFLLGWPGFWMFMMTFGAAGNGLKAYAWYQSALADLHSRD